MQVVLRFWLRQATLCINGVRGHDKIQPISLAQAASHMGLRAAVFAGFVGTADSSIPGIAFAGGPRIGFYLRGYGDRLVWRNWSRFVGMGALHRVLRLLFHHPIASFCDCSP